MTTMDCNTCNDTLLDLLYEELDEVRSAAVRRHLDGCASCAADYARLSNGRRAARSLGPVEAPAPNVALLDAIHAAAASNARPKSQSLADTVASVIPIESVQTRVPRWMRRVGEVAMRRQVAMAAVFLLMIGFGLSYHQLQSPTRPLPTSDEPVARVVRATELTPPESTAPPVERPVAARRMPSSRGLAPRQVEVHRAANAVPGGSSPTLATERQIERTHDAERAVAQALPAETTTRNTAENDRGAGAPGDNTLGPPTAAYRNQPAPPEPTAAPVIAARPALDSDLNRGLPAPPSFGNALNSATATPSGTNNYNGVNEGRAQQVWQAGSAPWQQLRDAADTHRTRGEINLAVSSYQSALAQDPPDADRVAIARALHETLLRAGRIVEAGEVQARYLARPTQTSELANQVRVTPTPSASATSSSVPRPAASRPMPSRAAPRMRRAPSNIDFQYQSAY
jgi:hypothetical protein